MTDRYGPFTQARETLWPELQTLMQKGRADYTLFYRQLRSDR